MYPKNKIGDRIYSVIPVAQELFQAAIELSDANTYNLVLHKHLGDVFYAFASKAAFEARHGKKLRFIVRPKHAFIAKMFDNTDVSVLDVDRYVLKSASVCRALLDKKDPRPFDADSVENWLFQAIFSCLPILGQPFVCENSIHLFFDGQLTCGLGSYRSYWAYRWAANMGVDEGFTFPFPTSVPDPSAEAAGAIASMGPLDRIVVLAPEAVTAVELEIDFWKILSAIIQRQGYTVVLNSDRYRIDGCLSAIDLGLSLADVISLCHRAAYVFSLRSGLCDVISNLGSRLYVFYPSMLRRELDSLNCLFEHEAPVHEVQISNWKINPFYWEGIDLSIPLQKDIDRLKIAYRKVLTKMRFSRKTQDLFWSKQYYEDIAAPATVCDGDWQTSRPNSAPTLRTDRAAYGGEHYSERN